VIVLDRAVLGDQFTCFIGADNVAIGHAAGQWIRQALGGAGAVVELKGLMTSTPGQDRHKGFRQAIEGSGIKVVFEADMQWLEPNARREMESALARFPNLDLVYAHNDPGAHGAYLAAKAAGREQEIQFVGIDALPQEGIAYVRRGILDATFQYPTGGAEAIDVALKLRDGQPVPKRITLGSRAYTKDNVDQGGTPIDIASLSRDQPKGPDP
jgi:ribose transport system substrate-binding protein